ncbi:PAS domain-containing sensor histidine kinase [Salinibaculum salinum]|uniref:PAS domain-containing sensor histidine kinase n=1 Tax=Salinibaculum salinum TaxID=3131996 RepID=UPI0030ED1285
MSESDPYGRLFELSRDAVAEIELIDQIPIVRAVNPAFVEVFGYDETAIVGESINDFIVPSPHAGEASTFDKRTADGESNWATVSRQTADGVREFLYRGVPFERDGEQRGLAIYTDITDQRRREQHHQVLHRVLRHNLRNDLTQILAAATTLLDERDDEVVQMQARRIRATVDDLEELSSAASTVEDLLGADSVERQSVDITETLQLLVSRYRETYPDATIEASIGEPREVTGDHRLGAALDALLENALEHSTPAPRQNGDTDGPVVRVSVTTTETEAVATIADNGPGIPEYERAAVFDERPLSQLSHGSGLGLWLAKWVIEGYGGRLTYERRGGETIVAARVPLASNGHAVPGQPQS